MKIAYVTIHVAAEIMKGGVGKKIKSHLSNWRENGHEVMLFSLSPTEIPFPGEKVFVFKQKSNFVLREINRSYMLGLMISAIQQYKPDIIYLRFGLYSYPLHRIFKIAPVAMEVNSNDIDEYRSRGLFFYWFNRLTRHIVFSRSTGLVPVTQEIADINAKYKKMVSVISNGIDLKAYAPIPAPKNNTPVLTIIGSPGMTWHGMDKLLPFARKFPELTIHIIGYESKDFLESVPPNIHAHGYLGQDEIRKILSCTDVVFGTLALHRKNMEELPPLKIREALAYGIPVIIAYKDTDLDKIAVNSVLQIPNNESNVLENAEKIRQFAFDMMGQRVNVEEIAPYFDQREKEKDRLAFFEKVIAGQKHLR